MLECNTIATDRSSRDRSVFRFGVHELRSSVNGVSVHELTVTWLVSAHSTVLKADISLQNENC